MPDPLSRQQRSSLMAKVKGKDTKPELVVRRLIHGMGYRYRLHRSDLPGKPDIVFPGRRKVIFVHGCFWHRHSCRRGQSLPQARRTWWTAKLERNAERDRSNTRRLRSLGLGVMIIWECQTKPANLEKLAARIRRFLNA
ncbi:MAG: very short patch repair endonuclease [Pseudomonadota bacterium]